MKVVAVLSGAELLSLRDGLAYAWGGTATLSLFTTDVEAAQAIVDQGRPDLLVVDLGMPGVIGADVIRSLRDQPELETLPILAVTSRSDQLESCTEGRTVALLKPVPPEAWKAAMRQALAVPLSHEDRPRKPAKAADEEGIQRVRKGERKPLELDCSVSAGARKVKGALKDLSISGARIALDDSLTVGSQITLSFAIPRSVPLKFLYIKARVVRPTPDGYGITFWQMEPLTRTYLNTLLK